MHTLVDSTWRTCGYDLVLPTSAVHLSFNRFILLIGSFCERKLPDTSWNLRPTIV